LSKWQTQQETAADSADGARAIVPDAGFTHIALTAFRNFRHIEIDLDTRPVALSGKNGAGKTNLLEALSFLAPGSGLRQARLGDVDLRQASNRGREMAWAVHARFSGPSGAFLLGTGRDPQGRDFQGRDWPGGVPPRNAAMGTQDAGAMTAGGRDRRLSRINGAPVKSQAAFAEILGIFWLTPESQRLFLDSPSARRRFLDRLAAGIDPTHAAHVGAYEKAVRGRAAVLRGETPGASAEINRWLDALEAEIAALAVAIAAGRHAIVRHLNAEMTQTTTTAAPSSPALASSSFPRALLAIGGTVEDWLLEMPALAAEDRLRAKLAEARVSDRDSGTTQWGTHRSDFLVSFLERDLAGRPLPAAEASTGEQKALLIAITLAEARLARRHRGIAPVLLLDEVAAHLDEDHRAALFQEILALGLQAWLTGTDPALFRPLGENAQHFALSATQARPLRL